MSITAVNAFYQGIQGPTVSKEVVASIFGGSNALDLQGFCLPVLDGSATTFTLNWIDGTATLPLPPSMALMFKSSPPAWTAATIYQVGQIVLGSAHVQQVTTAGKSAASAPTWKTDGTSVTEVGGPIWKDLGAEALSTIATVAITAITNLGATVTISAAGTSTQVPVISFRLMF